MSELVAENLTVRRGGRAILDAASLKAKGGEFIAVIGANGAGKSTLLSSLAGLLRSDSGTVRLDGVTIARLSRLDLARKLSFLPQSPRCEWPISVERLVALGLTPHLPLFGGLALSHRERIGKALADFDLTERRAQAATTLSGGELGRAMLARALVGDPDILIADEPMTGLDPRHVLDMARRLHGLTTRGKLVIAAAHDLTLAARYATRVVALYQGRIAADGPPAEIITPTLIRKVFDVDATISGVGYGAIVDYLRPASGEPT